MRFYQHARAWTSGATTRARRRSSRSAGASDALGSARRRETRGRPRRGRRTSTGCATLVERGLHRSRCYVARRSSGFVARAPAPARARRWRSSATRRCWRCVFAGATRYRGAVGLPARPASPPRALVARVERVRRAAVPPMRVATSIGSAGSAGPSATSSRCCRRCARSGSRREFVGLDDSAGRRAVLRRARRERRAVHAARRRRGELIRAAAVRGAARARRRTSLHTHLVHADVAGALGRRRARLVSTKHNDDPFRAGPFRFAERALTRRASRVIAITEALRQFCVERVGLPAAKVEVVHYGLDAPPGRLGAEPGPGASGRCARSSSASRASSRRRGSTRRCAR